MERIKTILRSGIRNINLVAPDARLTSRFREELIKSSPRSLSVEAGQQIKADASWCNLVCFSSRDEHLISTHIIFDSLVCAHSLKGSVALDLYEKLRTDCASPLSCKALMRSFPLGGFYKTRSIINTLSTSGLFFPVAGSRGRLYLIPYYYDRKDERILIIRHLLSLGCSVGVDDEVIKASLGERSLTVGWDISGINRTFPQGAKILITSHPVVNFSGIRCLSLSAFLESKQLW